VETFFVTTASGDGVDISDRGGNPGCVRVASPTELELP
jgi:hypothetical protein